jgi:hypothetical protein
MNTALFLMVNIFQRSDWKMKNSKFENFKKLFNWTKKTNKSTSMSDEQTPKLKHISEGMENKHMFVTGNQSTNIKTEETSSPVQNQTKRNWKEIATNEFNKLCAQEKENLKMNFILVGATGFFLN